MQADIIKKEAGPAVLAEAPSNTCAPMTPPAIVMSFTLNAGNVKCTSLDADTVTLLENMATGSQ